MRKISGLWLIYPGENRNEKGNLKDSERHDLMFFITTRISIADFHC